MLYSRVAAWNARRYDQELSLPLQLELQTEELNETIEAATDVDRLDGHVDQQFVALGGLWKLGCSEDQAVAVLEACDSYWTIATSQDSYDDIVQRLESHLQMLELAIEYGSTNASLAVVFGGIAALNACALHQLDYTAEERFAAAQVVCDSNDSKAVKKTATDVKANVDKGALFIAPEPRLQVIVDAMLARRQ
jgi:hypothetical protein